MSDIDGHVQFQPGNKANTGLGHITEKQGMGCEKQSITLDSFFKGGLNSRILIKMDIEGAEWLAIEGGRSILKENQDYISILMETHPHEIKSFGGDLHRLKKNLEDMKFTVKAIIPNGFQEIDDEEKYRFWWIYNQGT